MEENLMMTKMSANLLPEIPDLHAHILEHLFHFVDIPTLKDCRTVSQLWNQEAKSVLWKRGMVDCTKNYIKDETSGRCYLYSVISSSSNPKIFINWRITTEITHQENFHLLVHKFGMNVRDLTIVGIGYHGYKKFDECSHVLQNIHNILTNSCPNLTTLRLSFGLNPKDAGHLWRKIEFRSTMIQKPKAPLKLHVLELIGPVISVYPQFCFHIVKASPNLRKLRTWPPWTYDAGIHIHDIIYKSADFYEMLAQAPEITRKLEDFGWSSEKNVNHMDGTWQRPVGEVEGTFSNLLELVSTMEFSEELKTLRLGGNTDEQLVQDEFILRILEKVAPSLERLFIDGINMQSKGSHIILNPEEAEDDPELAEFEWQPHLPLSEFPIMENLTVLEISSQNDYGLCLLSFLQTLPNLVKFKMQRIFPVPITHCTPNLNADGVFRKELSMKKFPNRNLKSFQLHLAICDLESLETIIESFPCIQNLHFWIEESRRLWGRPHVEMNLERTFKLVSQLKNLERFVIGVNSKSLLSKQGIEGACRLVKKDFPKLRDLTIMQFYYSNISWVPEEFKGHPCEITWKENSMLDHYELWD